MNTPLPVVACKSCYKTQNYRGQENCIHCGEPMNKALKNWKVETPLQKHDAQMKKDVGDY